MVVDTLVGGIIAQLREGHLHSGLIGGGVHLFKDNPLKGRRHGDGDTDDKDTEDDSLGARLSADDLTLYRVTDGNVPVWGKKSHTD